MNWDRKANYTFVMEEGFLLSSLYPLKKEMRSESYKPCLFFIVEFGRSVKCRIWQGLAFRYLWDLDLWTETAAAVL